MSKPLFFEWSDQIRAHLEAIHPAAPWLAVTIGCWGAVYAVRRWLPTVWKWLESVGPADGGAAKIFQGLPAVIVGALLSVALTGGDFSAAAKGAAAGALAPLMHEWMKAYRGSTGKGA